MGIKRSANGTPICYDEIGSMSSEEQSGAQKAGGVTLVRPFVDALAEVADFRQQPQYELKIVLTVIVLGLLCGQNSERRIAAWAQHMPLSLRRRLKLPHLRVPSRGTIQRTVAQVNAASLVQAWYSWVEEALIGWMPHDALQGLAIDGKTLRGSADRSSGTAAVPRASARRSR